MRLISGRWLVLAVLLVAAADVLYAGQIYGTIVMGGQGVKDAPVEIKCGQEAAVSGATAADGTYRINVPQQGHDEVIRDLVRNRRPSSPLAR